MAALSHIRHILPKSLTRFSPLHYNFDVSYLLVNSRVDLVSVGSRVRGVSLGRGILSVN